MVCVVLPLKWYSEILRSIQLPSWPLQTRSNTILKPLGSIISSSRTPDAETSASLSSGHRHASSWWLVLLQLMTSVSTPLHRIPPAAGIVAVRRTAGQENSGLTQIGHPGNRVYYPSIFVKNLRNSLVFVKCFFRLPLSPLPPRPLESMCCCCWELP